jgi:SsrA-binding protein
MPAAKSKSKSAKSGKSAKPETRAVATNRRARFQYEVLDTFEAGISLLGPEVKSLRDGKANLGDAFAQIRNGEVILQRLHIGPYDPATRENADPMRPRKLLLHRHQIAKLSGRVEERGLTLVPLRLYFNEDGRAKVELALVRGKHAYDKRETIKRREADREAERAMRSGRGRGRR